MRINGFEQIKAFYSWVFNNPDKVRPTHISLYLFLWNQGNRANWVEWFKCPYDLAMQGACIGNKGTYYRCLDDLQTFELIKYKKGLNNYKAPQIHLIKLYDNEQVTVPLSEQLTEQVSEPLTELLTGNIYKLITSNYKLVNSNLEKWINSSLDLIETYSITDIKKEVQTLTALMNVLNINKLKLSNYFNEFSIQYLTDKFTHNEYKEKLTHFINYVKKQEKDIQKENAHEIGINGKYLGQAPKPLT